MRNGLKCLLMLAVILGVISCSQETAPEIHLDDSTSSYTLSYQKGAQVTVSFNSTADWSVTEVSEGLTVSPMSGKKGTALSVIAKAKSGVSQRNEPLRHSFVIVSGPEGGKVRQPITLEQNPPFRIKTTNHTIGSEGGVLKVDFEMDESIKPDEVLVGYDNTFQDMWENAQTRSYVSYEGSFKIKKNDSSQEREGGLVFAVEREGERLYSQPIYVKQAGAENAETSQDYSADGRVVTLQTHAKGLGIPVVLMGDGFLDKAVKDGSYDKAMKEAYGYLFSIEPMKSLKDWFDVHYVTAISENGVFGKGKKTAFGAEFEGGGSTLVTGNDERVLEYAAKVSGISSDKNAGEAYFKYSNLLAMVILNDSRYAGTCALYSAGEKREIPTGYSIAYIPMTKDTGMTFEQVLHHEAIGHGFGKLADEYYYSENDRLQKDSKEWNELKQWQGYGFYRNVDTENEVTRSLWAALAADSRYADEKLGCYEGGFEWVHGVYRATSESIMLNNTGGFNAVGREAIYKRAMMIAGGGDYRYVYDDFVAFDAPSWKSASGETRMAEPGRGSYGVPFYRPLAKPVLKIIQR